MPGTRAATRTVHAAGAVLWRAATGPDGTASGVEVAVVHRPHHHDWSLPKGKVDPGETRAQAAVREIAEETGFRVALGLPLGTTEYVLPNGRDKVVTYWAAEVPKEELERGRFTPNAEVDQIGRAHV